MTRKVILLVEDNDDDVALTHRAFEKHRLANEIVVASDGQQALDFLYGEEPLAPTVVLLDLNLPKLSGLDVLRRIRGDKRTELLPVVVLTSSDHDRDVIESYRLGANSFVRKPVDFLEFVEAARQLGLYWLMLNEPPKRRSDA
jgi:two-component system, response regulator